LASIDLNMPKFLNVSWYKGVAAAKAKWEVAVRGLLHSEPDILVSRMLYCRIPVLHDGPKLHVPQDIKGRHLYLTEGAGEEDVGLEDMKIEDQVRARISCPLN
jgi:hypothetical protein